MNKQLRIWLFALLGTLLATSSLLAEGVITMTTSKAVGEIILLNIQANGNVSIEGAQETGLTDDSGVPAYTISSQTITIQGDVTYLRCYESQLTNLDVSKNNVLKVLDCSGNQLTSLDVSKNTSLRGLDCYRNQLTSLDVSGCTALTWLECYVNQLTSLDVSKNTALTSLNCSSNQLTSLDVSGCTALTSLNCSSNQLTSLDVSGCTALTSLICYCNKIKEGEMTNLVNSLPDLGSNGAGAFKVYCNGDDSNICFAVHVATAQAKGWEALYTPYRSGRTWYDYTGRTTPLYTVTSSSTGCGSISLTGADDLNAVPYSTMLTVVATPADGYKLTALTANGEDILGTKSFVVKGATEVKATFVDHTGVETTVTQQVQLYPNPATDHLVVEGAAPASEVTLHSMTGERLYAGRADSQGTLRIELRPYADGVYLVCIVDETYRVVVRR